MAADTLGRLIDASAATIEENAERLTRLDQAIGDGDHGINLKRGFQAVAEQREALAALEPSQALGKAGMTLVMKVGGASGPLYGSLLMAMGKALQGISAEEPAGLAAALEAGIEAVKARGKSDVGQKTMLDVLVPAQAALAQAASEGLALPEILARVRAAAAEGLAATEPMRATKGRASFLGERSVGHLDPGAQSSALLIEAACRVLEDRA